ncbi:hypothetical protein UA08_04232 [Talaromyces atroroseus]|uniref:Uncharacterized protein n=1 Tax=Talaromyces atroroseus TaxID=1441469 RepID=A0A1Q5Q8C7_TALAT|nr:hypothetical protein UA08_04232 [Talaromyces atroroseus]OKL60388.1 hypothetical protein UA08_04232 [Talaromyces atroroseus]
MLLLPLWGICATAILTMFMPLVADVQRPSLSLLQEFSQNVFDGIKTRLGIRNGGELVRTPSARRVLTAVRLPPTTTPVYNYPIGYIDPLCPECPWPGPDGLFIWPTRDLSITVTPIIRTMTETQTETSLASVTPFKAAPTTHSPNWSFSSVSSLYSAYPLTYDLPKQANLIWIVGFLACVLGLFHSIVALMRICSKKSEEQAAPAAPAIAGQPDELKDLSKTNVALSLEKEEPYLEDFVKKIESQAESLETNKDSTSSTSDTERLLKIVEYLYVEEENPSLRRLISVNRWTITKAEFDSKYGCSSVPYSSSMASSTVAPKGLARRPPTRNESSTKHPIPTGSTTTPAEAPIPSVVLDCHVGRAPGVNKSSGAALSSDNSGLPVPGRYDSREPLTVVSDLHVEGTPVVNLPSRRAPDKPVVVCDGVDAEGKEVLPLIPLPSVPFPRLEPGEDSVPPTPPEKRRRRRNRMGQQQRRKRREEAEAKLTEDAGELGEAEEGRKEALVGSEVVWF